MIGFQDVKNFAAMGIGIATSVKGLKFEDLKPIVEQVLKTGAILTLDKLDDWEREELYRLAEYINELRIVKRCPGQVIFHLG